MCCNLVEMATIVQGMMKRKGLGEIYDDFTDLAVSAPSTKIRRLDAESHLTMEERQSVVGSILDDELSEGIKCNAAPNTGLIINQSFLPLAENDDRALVSYKHAHTQLSPSLNINPELITRLKRSVFSPGNTGVDNFVKCYQSSPNDCLAVVPWAPRSLLSDPEVEASTSITVLLEEPMEIEDDQLANSGVELESFHQSQKHCMMPELTLTTTSSPISWL